MQYCPLDATVKVLANIDSVPRWAEFGPEWRIPPALYYTFWLKRRERGDGLSGGRGKAHPAHSRRIGSDGQRRSVGRSVGGYIYSVVSGGRKASTNPRSTIHPRALASLREISLLFRASNPRDRTDDTGCVRVRTAGSSAVFAKETGRSRNPTSLSYSTLLYCMRTTDVDEVMKEVLVLPFKIERCRRQKMLGTRGSALQGTRRLFRMLVATFVFQNFACCWLVARTVATP